MGEKQRRSENVCEFSKMANPSGVAGREPEGLREEEEDEKEIIGIDFERKQGFPDSSPDVVAKAAGRRPTINIPWRLKFFAENHSKKHDFS